ncbi:MAG: hypothetical protein K8I02_03655, partial [Candidatus Methylomirabilis sp.]|nr:hypothetical protein [Deltaproteobacteria bacterium]
AALGMFRYLRGAPGGKLVGVTVDGPRGPAGAVKEGVLFLAKTTGIPLWVHKTYAKRHLRMPSWDRSYVPLPFNHVLQIMDGPFALPEGANAEDVERARREIESALARTAEEARRFFEKAR